MNGEKKYCYHCGAYHGINEMRQVATKTGNRWRCIRTIEASRADPEARAAFGRRMSEMNRENTKNNDLRLSNAENLRDEW